MCSPYPTGHRYFYQTTMNTYDPICHGRACLDDFPILHLRECLVDRFDIIEFGVVSEIEADSADRAGRILGYVIDNTRQGPGLCMTFK